VRVVSLVSGRAHARAGLLGNPSDIYEGKAIAVSVCNFTAGVTLEAADHFEIIRGEAEALTFPSLREMTETLHARGCYDGVRLLRAALRRFSDHWPALGALPGDDPRLRFTMRYTTDVPRQVGLGGSSAIVMAALRALMSWFEVEIEPTELAEITLAAEVEDLGITAGPMDRAIQAYEGALVMDFRAPRTARSYKRLDPELLPPLFVAWQPPTGRASGKIHGDVRTRWLAGDPHVRATIEEVAGLVEPGVACLEQGDVKGFQTLVDHNFDLRASIVNLSERDLEMVRIGRSQGAAVKLCGSGGSVVGVMQNVDEFPAIERAYAAKGYPAIQPKIVPDG
jgi:glucuronokinase